MQSLDDCYPWQPGGCEWTIRFMWRWMSSFGRLDVVVLTIILVYVLLLFFRVLWRFRLALPVSTRRKTLIAALNIDLGRLDSISVIAPFLGLLGTCVGVLNASRGIGMEKHIAMVMITTRVAAALVPSVVAIPAAVLATFCYNFLSSRIDLPEAEIFGKGQPPSPYVRQASRFQLEQRFSRLPAFSVIAASGLAIAITGLMSFASFHTPTGYDVELPQSGCEYDGDDRLIVLHITDSGKLFINQEQEEWNSLAGHLWEIYKFREYRVLHLVADPGVSFQTVSGVIDTVKNVPSRLGPRDRLDIRVRLVTPEMLNPNCLPKPVATGLGYHVLK